MGEWIDLQSDPVHVKRERQRARELRQTDWWRAALQKGVCHYCGKNVGAANLTAASARLMPGFAARFAAMRPSCASE